MIQVAQHQTNRQNKSFVQLLNKLSNECIGTPSMMKLPVGHEIDVNFITQRFEQFIKQYCQNFELCEPTKQKVIDLEMKKRNGNIKSFDGDSDDDH